MIDWIIIAVLILCIGAAVWQICKQKKCGSGCSCAGCSQAEICQNRLKEK